MNNIDLSLTPEEANLLLRIIDAAIRAEGLNIAGYATGFAYKIEAAAKANEVSDVDDPEADESDES